MPKLDSRNELTTPVLDDLLLIQDISDLGDGLTGTSKKIEAGTLLAGPSVFVAANDATDQEKRHANYVCDSAYDEVQIQAAIDNVAAETTLGGIVLFSTGTFEIRNPLTLPRTGLTPTNVVHLAGSGPYTTAIKGNPNFPADRALIEWETAAERTWEQSIQNIGFSLPNLVDGVMAIHYEPTDKSDWDAIRAELLQIDLINIHVQGYNTYNERCIYLEGVVYNSRFLHIQGDHGVDINGYETLLLETDYEIDAGVDPEYTEGPGIFNSVIIGLHGGSLRRGGHCRAFKGRLTESRMELGSCDGGTDGPSFEFINCRSSRFANFETEGRGEKPQYKFTNGHFLTVQNLAIGTPTAVNGGGVGNGLELINCNDCRIDTRFAGPAQADFSGFGVVVASIDATSERCILTNFGVAAVAGAGADELAIASSNLGNEIHWIDVATDTTGVLKDYVTENSGTGSIDAAATTDVIAHGLSVTPTIADISITLAEDPTNTPGAIWVDTIGAANFTVNCENVPGASNLDFGWRAVVL